MNETCLCGEMDLNTANPFLLCVAEDCTVKEGLSTKVIPNLLSAWLTHTQGSRISQAPLANTPSLPT